ncbi:MAG: hypothetical protein ACREQQ_02590 [Candidatus Binatia bacterium]
MQNILRILPIFAVVAVLGGAIYHVRSQAARPAPVDATKAPPASQNLLPASDRYTNPTEVER